MHAKIIIAKFGGQTTLATKLGKGQSTVAYWAKTGVIPARWQPVILQLAAQEGVSLRAEDFLTTLGVDESGDISPLNNDALTPLVHVEAASPGQESPTDLAPFLFYVSNDGAVKVRVLVEDETVWASQRGMSEIFGVDVRTISEHLRNVFKSGELIEDSVIRNFRIPASDGKEYDVNFYSLDAIISVGYRVNSFQATQFRKWATTVLKSYLVKGFVLDDERLKQGNALFGSDYFEELLQKIREIRASERRFYQRITDIYAQCSIDYDKDSPITHHFYANVQDKLHYAIHGHTSAELVELRADATKPNMGLRAWKNEAKGGKITKGDVTVGKNYLEKDEINLLERLVSQYLDFAESFAMRKKALTMRDWAARLDGFLRFNEYDILEDFGRISRDTAVRHAHGEYEKFRVVQDRDYRSDFDQVVDEIRIKNRLPNSARPI